MLEELLHKHNNFWYNEVFQIVQQQSIDIDSKCTMISQLFIHVIIWKFMLANCVKHNWQINTTNKLPQWLRKFVTHNSHNGLEPVTMFQKFKVKEGTLNAQSWELGMVGQRSFIANQLSPLMILYMYICFTWTCWANSLVGASTST